VANPDTDLQGVGVYLEQRSPNRLTGATHQLFIFPEGYTPTRQRIVPKVFHRHLNRYAPRKNWICAPLHLNEVDFSDEETVAELLLPPLARAVWGEYTLVGKPLLFEVSKKDMFEVARRKLPTRINLKIKTMRSAHGYPESVVEIEKKEEADG
jgi:hypothetical protein